MADKKAIVAALEEQIKTLESEIGKLKELASKVKTDSVKITAEVENLENEENILKYQFKELQKAGDAWKELELGMQKHLEELTMNLNTAMNKLKESVE